MKVEGGGSACLDACSIRIVGVRCVRERVRKMKGVGLLSEARVVGWSECGLIL